jgi:integrase
MNSQVRDTLFNLCSDRTSDGFVFDKDANEVNDYALRWGFEEACARAEIAFGETVPGGIIWHDLRRTFATRLRANGVHEYDILVISWATQVQALRKSTLVLRVRC